MSGLEDRCVSFHDAALGTGKSKGAAKEIATLRRFLHKNQNQRFTDKATARLFDTIQIYVSKTDSISRDDKEGLLEDALKMPFTVFGTKQKKVMLKWIEDLRAADVSSTTATAATAKSNTTRLTVLDVVPEDDAIHLLTVSGDASYEATLSTLEPTLRKTLEAVFATATDEVEVQAVLGEDGTSASIVSVIQ